MKNVLYLCILGGLLISALGCGGDDPQTGSQTESAIRPVRYITLQATEQDKIRTFSGTAEAEKESILSFKVSGTIQSIFVKVGDRVKKNTLLAELDRTDLMVDLESARARLKTSQADAKSAQTNVYTSESNYKRIQKLYENDNVSLSEFEQARGNYVTAQAQLDAARSYIKTETAKLKAAQNQLLYTQLKSPYNGVINRIDVEENEEISSGASIMTLSGLGNLEVKVNVSDLYITKIQKGMAAQITFPNLPDTTFKGIVTEVPYATSDAPTYPVSVGIQATDDRLRPGMAAQVLFLFQDTSEKTALYVPTDGVSQEGDNNYVFVIEPGKDGIGKVVKRNVRLGEITEQGFLIKAGLSGGELVATSGLQILMDGMMVKLVNDPIKEW